MNTKKAIKKIAALGMGATLVGATVLGAAAADLNDYPGMFIDNGEFDGIMVVGEDADSIDTIGMANIAMGLQAASVSETTVCEDENGDGTTIRVEDGVKIETSARSLYHYMTLNQVKPILDSTDMPAVLADGNYDNEEDFTQKLELLEGNADPQSRQGTNIFYHTQDDDDAPDAGYYLYMGDRTPAYEYILEFDNPVNFDDTDDLVGTTIELQGSTYTITGARLDGNDLLDELELLAGDTIRWITQGEEITHTVEGTEHTIRMVQITDEADPACGLEIDGSLQWLDQGETYTVGDLTVGVHDVRPIRTADYTSDICKISLGSQELVLSHGDEVEREGSDIEGSQAYLQRDSQVDRRAMQWGGLTIQWTPEDQTYLPFEGGIDDRQLIDPVFGNFRYVTSNAVSVTENIGFDMGSRYGDMTFKNSGGVEVEVPFVRVGDSVYPGDSDDADELVYFSNSPAFGDASNQCVFQGDAIDPNIDACEGARWLVSINGEAHMIELDNIDVEIDEDQDPDEYTYELELEDITYGRSTTTSFTVSDDDGVGDGRVYMPGFGNIYVDVSFDSVAEEGHIEFHTEPVTEIETEFGMELAQFDYDGEDFTIQWLEGDDPENSGSPLGPDAAYITTSIMSDGSDLEISPAFTNFADPVQLSPDDDDIDVYASTRGTVAEYDTDDNQDMTIKYPANDVYGEVYISPTEAGVSEIVVGENCYTETEVNKIPSTATKLDTEVDGVSEGVVPQNMITVGGPCANQVTAALMGNPEDCEEGFEDDMALLRLVEDGNNIALIVAGGLGKDTRIASTVLQHHEDYLDELQGTELELTTISENNIGFQTVE